MIAGVGLAGLAALAAFGVRVEHRRQALELELAGLNRTQTERTELLRLRRQLQSVVDQFGSHAALRKRANLAGQLAREAQGAEMQLRNLQLKADPAHPPEPIWPDNAEVWPAKDWKDAGNATPRDAVETLLWAASSGDVVKLAGMISLHDQALQGAQLLYDQLSPQDQARYGSPELLVASAMASLMPTDYQAAAAYDDATYARSGYGVSKVRVEQADGRERDLFFNFDRVDDGYRLNIPLKEIGVVAQQLKISVPKIPASLIPSNLKP